MLARPGLPTFDYIVPATPNQVVQLLQEHGNAVRLMMGGTDLFVRMRQGAIRPKILVDVKHLPGMRDIQHDERAGLTVGAAVTMNEVASHAPVRAHYPLLAEAAHSVASYQVRNRATMGGNLCNASPCADTAPAVLVLEGDIVLYGASGERAVPAEEFFVGPGSSVIQPDEFLTGIRFPLPPNGSQGKYMKLGRSKAGDLALVGVAVLGFPDKTAASGYGFRIALGSVAPVPLRVAAAEKVLALRPPDENAFALAAEKAMQAAAPIDDVRASAAYQKAMVRTFTLRGLQKVWGQLCNT